MGQYVAEKEVASNKQCIHSNAPAEECISLLENGKAIATGRFVARSATHLALFNQGKTSIYPVKDQLVEVVPTRKLQSR